MYCALSFDIMLIGFDVFCFQAEDGIRDLVRSRGLGDVYKRQMMVEEGLLLRDDDGRYWRDEVSF